MPIPTLSLATAVAALLGVVGLVLLAGRAARATGFARLTTSSRLVLRDSLALDRARSLRIVSCDGRDVLLLLGGGNDIVVGWLPGAEDRA
jgi:flagellar protein FliO/FliZ